MMMPRFEPDEPVSGVGVVAGGVSTGGGGLAAVVVGLGVVLVVGLGVVPVVGLGLVLVAGTIASTVTTGADTVVVLPTESAVSLALTTGAVILSFTAVAFVELLSILISVTTSAVPMAASSRLSTEKPDVVTVLMVSTVALITALGAVHAVSYTLFTVTVMGL
jgi:hypothetical protein